MFVIVLFFNLKLNYTALLFWGESWRLVLVCLILFLMLSRRWILTFWLLLLRWLFRFRRWLILLWLGLLLRLLLWLLHNYSTSRMNRFSFISICVHCLSTRILVNRLCINDILNWMRFSEDSFLFLSWNPVYSCLSIRLVSFGYILLVPCSYSKSTHVMSLNFCICMYSNRLEIYQDIVV